MWFHAEINRIQSLVLKFLEGDPMADPNAMENGIIVMELCEIYVIQVSQRIQICIYYSHTLSTAHLKS